MAVLLVDVGLAIYILPKDPAMDLFIYSDGVQVDFTIGEFFLVETDDDMSMWPTVEEKDIKQVLQRAK